MISRCAGSRGSIAPLQAQRADERADWQIFQGLGAAYCAAAGKEWRPLPPPRALIGLGWRRAAADWTWRRSRPRRMASTSARLRPSLLERLETADRRIACRAGDVRRRPRAPRRRDAADRDR